MNQIRIDVKDQDGNVLEIQRVVDNIGNWTIIVVLPDPQRSRTMRAPVPPSALWILA